MRSSRCQAADTTGHLQRAMVRCDAMTVANTNRCGQRCAAPVGAARGTVSTHRGAISAWPIAIEYQPLAISFAVPAVLMRSLDDDKEE